MIICNHTGVFDSLPFGPFCVTVHDPCYDTTITRCFAILPPTVTNDIHINFSNYGCNTVTITATSNTLNSTQYCLYNSSNQLILCNTTGIFSNLPYGSYCLKTRVQCPDTTMLNCFTINKPQPSVQATPNYSNFTCISYSAKITGQTNLTNPLYCLLLNNIQLYCNYTGVFDNLSYGANYCIKIINTCYDTTMYVCFSKLKTPVQLTANSNKSCSYGYGNIQLNFNGGYLPVNVKIFYPNGNLLLNKNYNSNSITIDSIPGIPVAQYYKIIATDNCGNKDTAQIGVVASYFTHTPLISYKCPSAGTPVGSGDIRVSTTTNMGQVQVRIIKRNGVTYSPSLSPNSVINGVHTFSNLTPATYILRYSEDQCNNLIYDTILLRNYTFPNLSKSIAYQCDNGGFNVNAIATGGVNPFLYEIIGSSPSFPSIVTPPQSNPVFNINNGAMYALIRLRAVDACGNGTLGDASVLPLTNTSIQTSLDCYAGPTTLTVDSIFNATYAWYKKTNLTSPDSIFLGSGSTSYFIPSLSPADTGIYICKVIVNSGCITRLNYAHVTGNCGQILPTILKSFTGNIDVNNIHLQWTTAQENNLQLFTLEKKVQNHFMPIGNVMAVGNSNLPVAYAFTDLYTSVGEPIYRLKLQQNDGRFCYSNILRLSPSSINSVSVFPNPIEDNITIHFNQNTSKNLRLEISNYLGQIVFTKSYTNVLQQLRLQKPNSLKTGIYNLSIFNEKDGSIVVSKIIVK